MLLESVLKGFVVGIGASIPLGPLGVMCVQKSLSKGRISGIMTGLGASLTDTFFAALAILSLAIIQNFISDHDISVLLLGGLIVIGIGLKIFLTNPVKQIRKNKEGKKLFEDFLSAVIMTITNPGAVFLILGLFAFVGLNVDRSSSGEVIFTALLGVFLGANAWWIILSTTIDIFRNKFRLRQLFMINRIAGIVIMVLGFFSVADGIWRLLKHYFY